MDLAQVVGHLAVLRRFPIEPFSGETPSEALLSGDELLGDRLGVLLDEATGERIAPEAAPLLLRCGARFFDESAGAGLDSRVLVRVEGGGEHALSAPAWVAEVSRRLGRPVRLAARSALRGDAPDLQLLSLPTLKFLESAYGRALEPARLRANFLVDLHGRKAFEEDTWIGKRVRIGDAELDIVSPSLGCVLTGLEPESGGDVRMLRGVREVRGGSLGVLVHPVSGHRVRVGDPVSRVD